MSTADRVAAWATGAGVGLIAFMLVWLVGNRLAGLLWGAAAGAIAALGGAVVIGVTTALLFGLRLARRSSPPG